MALINGLFYSKSLEFSTNVTIIMPDDIKENEEINVLFLLHGFNGGYLDFIRHTSVEKIALKNRVAVIMPEVNNSFYTNTGYGQKYYDYIAYELPNIIKNMFNIKITKKNSYIAGLSMGGYGALKIAFNNPENYSKVAGISSVVDIVNMYDMNENRKDLFKSIFGSKKELVNDSINNLYNVVEFKKSFDLKIYLSCGTEDFLYEDNLSFSKFLNSRNVNHDFIVKNGTHNWEYWQSEINKVFDFFFNK